jgi:glutamate racemase
MDQRPIGVFDSGLGGLTAVREMRRLMPSENIIYFGDTSRVPYGGRSPEILLKYARQDVHFLRSFDIKAVLVACGTVSTTALPQLQAENDLPILGVVEPASATPVVVEDGVLVGANAVVIEGVRIGAGAVVAAGAVVTENVPPNAVVAGTPARIIKMKDARTEGKTALVDALRSL